MQLKKKSRVDSTIEFPVNYEKVQSYELFTSVTANVQAKKKTKK